jgi:hypothetical protein
MERADHIVFAAVAIGGEGAAAGPAGRDRLRLLGIEATGGDGNRLGQRLV